MVGRAKTMNEKIYYNVDTIHQAVAQNRQISFQYYEYTVGGQKSYRRNGKKYVASPYALTWNDEYYYMIAYYEAYDDISHFRVDKMENIEILGAARSGVSRLDAFDLAEYSKKTFNMFSGPEENVTLRVDNSLIGVVLDRFGTDTLIVPGNDGTFTTHVGAFLSPAFFGWLFSFGTKMQVIAPERLKEEFAAQCISLAAQYDRSADDA